MSDLGFKGNIAQFSTHSLRIGGASILAAAGMADCVIQKMGGWKSLAFLKYIRLSIEAFGKCYAALTSTTILSNSHLTRLLPNFSTSDCRSPLALQAIVTSTPNL